jgi:uncharacterized protein YdhG (YjbR/CyaY superfamily)
MDSKSNTGITTVGEYFASLPEQARAALEQLRLTIKKAAPEAEEVISYQMPAFRFHGVLVYYAAFKNHFSFFPASGAVEVFKDKLTAYETSKGTIRFPFGKPLPVGLITEIVQYRVKENLAKKEFKELAKRKKLKK